jgi:ArsR family transcriptional regulator, lead/cadmium/zinc/bismuth-responsive transcriptional repressor
MSHLPQHEPATVIDLQTATHLAEIFAALADPTRLRIISALSHHELNVGELSRLIGSSESATSHQLRLLRTQRIVRTRKEGRQVYYALDDEHIHDLLDRGIAHVEHE